MIFANLLKRFFFISFLFPVLMQGQVVFCPFINSSDYSGKWNLAKEIPDFFSRFGRNRNDSLLIAASTLISKLEDAGGHDTRSFDLQEILNAARFFKAKRAVTGHILSFDIDRAVVGEPTLAGYENYMFTLKIAFKVIDVENQNVLANDVIDVSRSRNSLGLTLFGKPSDNKREFYGLDNISISSQEFSKTLIAEGLEEAGEKLFDSEDYLRSLIQKKIAPESSPYGLAGNSASAKVVSGEILLLNEQSSEAFVNIGSRDGINIGDKLTVFRKGPPLFDPVTNENLGDSEIPVAELVVSEIRGPKLSIGTVVSQKETILKGLLVKRNPLLHR